MKINTHPKANGATQVFALNHSSRKREGIPKNEQPRSGKAGSSVTCAANTEGYNGTELGQARSPDLFGPPQEWSNAAEHWAFEQWQAVNAILFNGNTDPHEFLLCHESPNPKERFNKAKRAEFGWHVRQAYETVSGTAKRRSGIGFYPWAGATCRQSYWGAFDFDAHEGQSPLRARQLAARLVDLLQRKSTASVIGCTSGLSGGWHVFIFRPLPRPIAEWSMYLRKLAGEIGATVATPDKGGDCELHPIETDERPRGIRAPGSLNPKDGTFGLIAFDSLSARLHEWKEILPAKLPRGKGSGGSGSPRAIIVLGNLFVDKLCAHYVIRCERTRQNRMVQMVGQMVNQCGEEIALKAVAQQYKQALIPPQTPLSEALALFARSWRDLTKTEVGKLNPAERRVYQACNSDIERSAFLIIRNWLVNGDGYVHRNTLAARLGIEPQYAGRIRSRFCEQGIMRMTQDYVIHQLSRRYQWLLNDSAD